MFHRWILFATQAQVRGVMRPHQALGEGGCLSFLRCFTLAAPHSKISGAAGFAICRQIADTSNNAVQPFAFNQSVLQ